jgi:hypothetical protein
VAEAVDLRARDIYAIELTLEGAGACLRQPDRNKRPARCTFGGAASIDPRSVSTLHPACPGVDAFFEIGKRRGCLARLIERR